MAIDPFLLSALREEAKALFADGDKHRAAYEESYARGNDIRKAIALLEGNQAAFQPPRQAALSPAGSTSPRRTIKGKPPGAMSQRWRGHFAEIFRSHGPTFSIANVQTVIAQREQREMRDSEVRRLFEGNVKHGYLVVPGAGFYQATAKLMDLIGLSSFNSGSPLPNVASQAPLFGPPTQETTHGA